VYKESKMSKLLILFFLLAVCFIQYEAMQQKSFVIDYDHDQFLKDGKPFRYISGGIHYFRVPEEYWEDRLYKIRKSGCNAIQTYIPWNWHEPYEGQYQNFNKLVNFIKLAQKHDLLVILRGGPYVCGEWEFGGFPYWLLKNSSIKLRTSDKVFLTYVETWLSKLLTVLRPLLYANGGPVIMLQVENEYGSYGCDHNYVNMLGSMFKKYVGDDVILFTTDGAGDGFLKCGAVDSLYTTVDFGAGGDPAKTFLIQRKYQSHGPYVNSEYYTGWLDHWGEHHQTRGSAQIAEYVDKILATNASLNMYMFEGGTNFGFMNGANGGNPIQPQPTSYDYDAPLSEAGDPTEKYFAIQKVISKYVAIPEGPQPTATVKMAYGKVNGKKVASVLDIIDKLTPVVAVNPLSFEDIDVPYGYVLYTTNIASHSLDDVKLNLTLTKYHDRAHIFTDKNLQGIMQMNEPSHSINISAGTVLDILVENQGRINYGSYLADTKKGLLADVLLDGSKLENWSMRGFNGTELLTNELFENRLTNMTSLPAAVMFTLTIDEIHDTYLKLDMWTKGFVLLNGVNLGRYWTPVGPQKTLYVPKFYLKSNNTVIVCETDKLPTLEDSYIDFVDAPIFT